MAKDNEEGFIRSAEPCRDLRTFRNLALRIKSVELNRGAPVMGIESRYTLCLRWDGEVGRRLQDPVFNLLPASFLLHCISSRSLNRTFFPVGTDSPWPSWQEALASSFCSIPSPWKVTN